MEKKDKINEQDLEKVSGGGHGPRVFLKSGVVKGIDANTTIDKGKARHNIDLTSLDNTVVKK